MSPSVSTEAVALEGIGRGLGLIFPAVSRGGIRSVIPLTMINARASQNNSVCLVLRYWKVPLAALALSLNKCQHVQTEFRKFGYIH